MVINGAEGTLHLRHESERLTFLSYFLFSYDKDIKFLSGKFIPMGHYHILADKLHELYQQEIMDLVYASLRNCGIRLPEELDFEIEFPYRIIWSRH